MYIEKWTVQWIIIYLSTISVIGRSLALIRLHSSSLHFTIHFVSCVVVFCVIIGSTMCDREA